MMIEANYSATNTSGVSKNGRAFVLVLSLIVALGLIMVYSASYMYAKDLAGTTIFFLLRQLVYVFLGIGIAWGVSRTRMSFWLKYSYYINWFSVFILILTFVPGLGLFLKGSYRWIRIAGMTFQPGELAKFTTLLAAVTYFARFSHYTTKQRLLYLLSVLAPMLVLILQPDFGTFAISFTVIVVVCFFSEFPRKWFWSAVGGGSVLGLIVLVSAPYRWKRILTYLDPWKDPQNTGFQIIQSYLAFGNGAFWGQGIGNSSEKLFYLPEAHNDFIFSVIGEELGFVGVSVVVLLFLALLYFGLRMTLEARHRVFAMIIASITSIICFQAFLNMGVVLGLLPTKGLNLPFISFGGSSLISNFFAIGIMFAARRAMEHEYPFSDDGKGNSTLANQRTGSSPSYYSSNRFKKG